MRRLQTSTVILTLCWVSLTVGLAIAQDAGLADHRPGELLVQFDAGADPRAVERILGELGGEPIRSLASGRTTHLRIRTLGVAAAIERYRDDPAIVYIEPNYILRADRTPNDPEFDRQWGMDNRGQTAGLPGADISATEAWDVFTGSRDVIVAILDTGIDLGHFDLADNIYINPGEIPDNDIDDDGNGYVDDVHGWDFHQHDNQPTDVEGHGTHVAGIVGAIGDNGIGVAGVSWNVTLLPVRFLGPGGGSTDGAVRSIDYAVAMGARIINASWGGSGFSTALSNAIERARDAGVLVVAAAGNAASNLESRAHYPASFDHPNIIAVAATDDEDRLADFSNFGPISVDLAAPGSNIFSTVLGPSLGFSSGTSMAAPHVAGALALVMGRLPEIGAADAKERLLSLVDPLDALEGQVATGGRLNALLPVADPDTILPAPITDVRVTEVGGSRVRLAWTATGDDGRSGSATRYDIRYSTSPIDAANFDAAQRSPGRRVPVPAGELDEALIEGLAFATHYYFAVVAEDEFRNPSPLSNLATATTLDPPEIRVQPERIEADLRTGETVTRTMTIENHGPSELEFEIIVHRPRTPPGLLPRREVPERRGEFLLPSYAQSRYDDGRTPRWLGEPLATPNPGLQPLTQPTDLRILLLWGGINIDDIRSVLADLPDVAHVDVFNAADAVPTPADLEPYDAVILITNRPYLDPDRTGDVVADYVDAGGGVIMALASFIPGRNVGGRFWQEGYSPMIGSSPGVFSSLGNFNALHPIMAGVTGAIGDLLATTRLTSGAELVASWDRGLPAVAVKGPNVAAVNVFLDGGRFWVGDIPLILRNAAAWASENSVPWMRTAPVLGTVAPGGHRDVTVVFDTRSLLGGDYGAEVAVRSNDPNPQDASIVIDLHVTGAPDLVVSREIVGFGPVMMETAARKTLTITNHGTDRLIVSRLSIDMPEFEADQATFSLAPQESLEVGVTFRPRQKPAVQAVMTIESNDATEPSRELRLIGLGIVPPVIAVAPERMQAALLPNGQSTRTLAIENRGASDLRWSAGFDFDGGVGDIVSRMASEFIVFEDDMENGPNEWTHYATHESDVDLWEQTRQRRSSGSTSWRVVQHTGAGSDALQSPEIDLSLYTEATLTFRHLYDFDDCGIDVFEPDGGFLEISADGGTTWERIEPEGGYPYRIDNSCDNPRRFYPAYAHLGVDEGEFLTAVFDLTPYARQRVHLRFHAAWDCGNCVRREGWYIDDVKVFSQSPTWLTTQAIAGVIRPGASSEIEVLLDATGLQSGRYSGRIELSSNDPLQPMARVPMELEVVDALCGLDVEVSVEPEFVVPAARQDCQDAGGARRVSFVYTGASCADSRHRQGDRAACTDLLPLEAPVRVLYVGPHLGYVTVEPATATIGIGDTVTVTASGRASLGGTVELLVLEPDDPRAGSDQVMNRVLQSLEIATACDAPLAIGDTFGALTVAALDGRAPGEGEVVTYRYTVTNRHAPIEGVTLVDDRLGVIAEGLSLARGETRDFERVARVIGTTTSQVTAIGTLAAASARTCSGAATTTVTVLDPSATCTAGALRALVFEYTGDNCSASRNGQGKRAKCSDHSTIAGPVRVTYEGRNAAETQVLPHGEIVRIGDHIVVAAIGRDQLADKTTLEIWQGATRVQRVELETSCKRPLEVGDQFGALKLREMRTTLQVADVSGDADRPRFALGHATPNPMRATTNVAYSLARPGHVELTIHDVQGRRIATLVDEPRASGRHDVSWGGRTESGRRAPAGLYLMRLASADGVRSTRLVVLE